jgi:hypothetical protein
MALALVAMALPASACSPVVQLIMALGGPAGWRTMQANQFTTVTGYLMAAALGAALTIPGRWQAPGFLIGF